MTSFISALGSRLVLLQIGSALGRYCGGNRGGRAKADTCHHRFLSFSSYHLRFILFMSFHSCHSSFISCHLSFNLSYRDKERGEAAVTALEAEGLKPTLAIVDLEDVASIEALAATIKEKHG